MKLDAVEATGRVVKVFGSSNIDALGYDFSGQKMYVRFNSGRTYEYSPVAPTLFGQLVSAESVGATFNIIFRNNPSFKTKEIV